MLATAVLSSMANAIAVAGGSFDQEASGSAGPFELASLTVVAFKAARISPFAKASKVVAAIVDNSIFQLRFDVTIGFQA